MSEVKPLAPDSAPEGGTVQEPISSAPGQDEVFPHTLGEVTPLIDGERAFAEMHDKISNLGAGSYLYISMWFVQLTTVVKDASGKKTPSIANLIKEAAKRGVQIYILISHLDCLTVPINTGGKASNINVGFCDATPAATLAKQMRDLNKPNIYAIAVKHPFKISLGKLSFIPGSFHEKLMIIDRRYVFCGGLEFMNSYTNADPTHVKKNADKAATLREKVIPISNRHDVHSLIEGSVVKHFESHFVARWNEAKSDTDQAIPALVGPPPEKQFYDPQKNKHVVQVAITKSTDGQPNYKTISQGVFDAYIAAVKAAKQYIYIENQYFRDGRLTAALLDQLKQEPDLQIIILLPVKAEEKPDPFVLHAEFIQHQMIEQLTTSAHSKRVGVFSLRLKHDEGFDIYVHAKTMIVDDKWLTIGSANTNPRSFFLDSEINILVRDDKLAETYRTALWTEHFQPDPALLNRFELSQSKDFVAMWDGIAKLNDAALKQKKALNGRVITHVPSKGEKLDLKKLGTPVMRLLQVMIDNGVGPNPDMFVGDFPVLPIA